MATDKLKISKSEMDALITAAAEAMDVSHNVASEMFRNYIEDFLASDAMKKISEAKYTEYLAAITGPANPQAIEAARRLANRATEQIAGELVKSELTKIGNAVAQGIEAGQDFERIARNLDAVKGLDTARAARYAKYRDYLDTLDIPMDVYEQRLETFYKKELRDRKRVIAQNEQRRATGEAEYQGSIDGGKQYKTWITAGDSRVSDVCVGNEGQGWIPIKDNFGSGVAHVPAHPRCRCTVAYRTLPPNTVAQGRARERAAKTEAAIAAATETNGVV